MAAAVAAIGNGAPPNVTNVHEYMKILKFT